MRHVPNLRIEQYRRRHPLLGWSPAGENYGYFEVQRPGGLLRVIASDGSQPEECGWEHVSVSLASRCPTWEEMAFVKGLFWADEETVLQFHPAKSQAIDHMPYCLHLWRNRLGGNVALPPAYLIGPQKSIEVPAVVE